MFKESNIFLLIHIGLDHLNITLYQPFNRIINKRFVPGISNGFEVAASSDVEIVSAFINNGLAVVANDVIVADQDILKYISDNFFMFSAWIRHSCESNSDYQPIIISSLVALVCCPMIDDFSSTASPIMALHNDCLYALPGKSGLWYNFAFVINENISIYIDGELTYSDCIATNYSLETEESVRVLQVGSKETIIDEIFIGGGIAPKALFWRQLTGNNNEPMKEIRNLAKGITHKTMQIIDLNFFDFYC